MSSTTQKLYLEQKNKHDIDEHLFFDEAPHIYYIDGSSRNVISTTTFIHCYFSPFDAVKISEIIVSSGKNPDYIGMTAHEIQNKWKEASCLGTALHRRIELFYNGIVEKIVEKNGKSIRKLVKRDRYKKQTNGQIINVNTGKEDDEIEFNYFLKFYFDHKHLEPYRTEWIVYDPELRIAGSIDMVFKRDDGRLELGDWKRTKRITKINEYDKTGFYTLSHLPDANFWQYSLQLNIYRTILEKYYGQKVAEMYLIWINASNKSYIKIIIPRMDKEVQEIMNDRRTNLDLDKETFHNMIVSKHKNQCKNYSNDPGDDCMSRQRIPTKCVF